VFKHSTILQKPGLETVCRGNGLLAVLLSSALLPFYPKIDDGSAEEGMIAKQKARCSSKQCQEQNLANASPPTMNLTWHIQPAQKRHCTNHQ
jgi:hypothetical protein